MRNEGTEDAKLKDHNLEILERCKLELLLKISTKKGVVAASSGVHAVVNFVDGLSFDAADEFPQFFPPLTEAQGAVAKEGYDLLLKTDIMEVKRWGMVVYMTMYNTIREYLAAWSFHEKKRLVFPPGSKPEQRYHLSNTHSALMGGRKFPLGITEEGLKKIMETIAILQNNIIKPRPHVF